MIFRHLVRSFLFAAFVVPTLTAGSAFAEERTDHARFRGGIALQGGALVAPGIFTLGLGGVQGQLGAQINNMIGVYAVPSFDIVFGSVGGVNIGGAILVDFTLLNDLLTVGVGPDTDVFAAIGASTTTARAAAGALYGGRIHLAVNPVVGHGVDPVRRKAFVIGLDVRLLVGGVGAASSTGSAAVAGFVLAPMLTIGYQAF